MAEPPVTVYLDSTSFNSVVHDPFLLRSDKMSIFHINIRSLQNKWFEIETALDSLDNRFDLLAFTETWFSSEHDVVNFAGYKSEGVY